MEQVPRTEDGLPDLDYIWSIQQDDLQEWVRLRLTNQDPYLPTDPRTLENPRAVFVWAWKEADPQHPYRERLTKVFRDLAIPALLGQDTVQASWLNELLLLGIETKQSLPPQLLQKAFDDQRFIEGEFYEKGVDKTILDFLGHQRKLIKPPNFWNNLLRHPRYALTAFLALKRVYGIDAIANLELLINTHLNYPKEVSIDALAFFMAEDFGVDQLMQALQHHLSSDKQEIFYKSLRDVGFDIPPKEVRLVPILPPSGPILWRQLLSKYDHAKQMKLYKIMLGGGIPKIFPYVLPEIAAEPETEIAKFFSEFFNILKGGELIQVGKELGKVMAMLEEDKREKLWGGLLNATESNGKPDLRIFTGYAVIGIADYRYKKNWEINESEIGDLVDKILKVRDQADKLVKTWKRYGPNLNNPLIIGRGPFHEEILITELFRLLVPLKDLYSEVEDTYWGDSGKNANLAVYNEAAFSGNGYKNKYKTIFTFKGYYVFARRNWLENLDASSLSEKVNIARKNLLSSGNCYSPSIDCDERRKLEKAQARAWLAIYGELKYKADTDFARIWEVLYNSNTNPPDIKKELLRIVDYNEYFESFIKGEINVFLGGAIHAALLRRWWSGSRSMNGPVINILDPDMIELLIQQHISPDMRFPMRNRLFFTRGLRPTTNTKEFSKLTSELKNTYIKIAEVLDLLARQWKTNPDCLKVLKYLTGVLKSQAGEHKWSFLTDEEDLAYILTTDDNFLILSKAHTQRPKAADKSHSKVVQFPPKRLNLAPKSEQSK